MLQSLSCSFCVNALKPSRHPMGFPSPTRDSCLECQRLACVGLPSSVPGEITYKGKGPGLGKVALPSGIPCFILYLVLTGPPFSLFFILFSYLPVAFPSFQPPLWRPPSCFCPALPDKLLSLSWSSGVLAASPI